MALAQNDWSIKLLIFCKREWGHHWTCDSVLLVFDWGHHGWTPPNHAVLQSISWLTSGKIYRIFCSNPGTTQRNKQRFFFSIRFFFCLPAALHPIFFELTTSCFIKKKKVENNIRMTLSLSVLSHLIKESYNTPGRVTTKPPLHSRRRGVYITFFKCRNTFFCISWVH